MKDKSDVWFQFGIGDFGVSSFNSLRDRDVDINSVYKKIRTQLERKKEKLSKNIIIIITNFN